MKNEKYTAIPSVIFKHKKKRAQKPGIRWHEGAISHLESDGIKNMGHTIR